MRRRLVECTNEKTEVGKVTKRWSTLEELVSLIGPVTLLEKRLENQRESIQTVKA